MKKVFVAVFFFLTLSCTSEGALTFDLWENMDNPGGRFYGYSTRSVGNTPGEDGNFDRSGTIQSETGVVQNISWNANGDVTYTSSNPFRGGGTMFVDIDLKNMTNPLGASTYGIDAINQFTVYYDLVASFTGGIAGVNAYFIYPGGNLSAGSPEAYLLGQVDTGVGRSFSFRSEDLYARSQSAPLVRNGETGTLRFEFSSYSTAPSGGNGTVTLSNVLITAVVPEPSSSLLLSGVLGLFGATFRRRRQLMVAE
jgi:hypothetical protein